MSTNLIIALIAICLFFSALLSGSETAITYVPREKIHQLSDSKRNNKIKKAKDDLEQTIGGILVANNFVNILMASLSTILFVNFSIILSFDIALDFKDHFFNGGKILGIWLALQLLFESSEEAPGINGLGLLKGKVKNIIQKSFSYLS